MVVIYHPPDCDCGRHVKCGICFDTGYVRVRYDTNGFHGEPCPKCKVRVDTPRPSVLESRLQVGAAH